MRPHTIALLFALFASPLLRAQAYYVSAKGDDQHSGLAADQAWKTVAKVSGTKFNSGDRILFKRGDEWREQLRISSSGAEGKPIVYEAYGEGPKPKFWGSDVLDKNAFEAIGPDAWKITVPFAPDWHAGVAVDHELLPNAIKPGSPDPLATIKSKPKQLWIDMPARTIYFSFPGANPKTDARVYTYCSRQDVVVCAQKHIVLRDLVVDECARIEGGYAFRIEGSVDVRLEGCEAWRVGAAHFGIVNSDRIVCERLLASYAMPMQNYIRCTAYFVNCGGPSTIQFKDCVAEHLENGPGFRNYDALAVLGDGTGTVTATNMVCKGFGGGGATFGGKLNVKVLGGIFENSCWTCYSSNVLLDGVTITGELGCVDFWGSNNTIQNCVFRDIAPTKGGPAGHSAAIVIRDKAKNNTIRFNTFVASDSAVCVALAGKGSQTRLFGNILMCSKIISGLGGGADASDLALCDWNLYRASAKFSDKNLDLAAWRALSFDAHSLTGEPRFADAAAGRFALAAGSPGIDAATLDPALAPATDAGNTPRPAGKAFDMGAYESAAP